MTGSANFALFPIQTTIDPPTTKEDFTDIPTGATTVDQAAVSASPVHQEGIDHIKSQIDSTTAAPPASNPGADDATGGIAPGAGGVSGAAYKDPENPATTAANKRKSILGTFKGYLGLQDRTKSQQGKETATTTSTTNSDGTYIGAATAAVTGTAAAVAETVQAYTVGTTDDKAATTGEAAKTEDTTTPAAAAEESTADKDDKAPAIDGTTSTEEAVKDPDTGDAKSIKHDKGPGGTNLVNPDAIPTAGGKKVGEDTWGESKIVPDDPGPPKEETETAGAATVSSSAGQPTSKSRHSLSIVDQDGAEPGTDICFLPSYRGSCRQHCREHRLSYQWPSSNHHDED